MIAKILAAGDIRHQPSSDGAKSNSSKPNIGRAALPAPLRRSASFLPPERVCAVAAGYFFNPFKSQVARAVLTQCFATAGELRPLSAMNEPGRAGEFAATENIAGATYPRFVQNLSNAYPRLIQGLCKACARFSAARVVRPEESATMVDQASGSHMGVRGITVSYVGFLAWFVAIE